MVLSHPFHCIGYCRDSGADVFANGVDRPRESVWVFLWVHAGVFHCVCLRPFRIVGLVRSWSGDVASCRDRRESLFICPASHICSVGAWSVASPRRLAWRELGRQMGQREVHGPRFGYPFLEYPAYFLTTIYGSQNTLQPTCHMTFESCGLCDALGSTTSS
jgi:hypothetical protein